MFLLPLALALVFADSKEEPKSKESPPPAGWTMNLAKMKIPDTPVAGKLCGLDFKPEAIKWEPTVKTVKLVIGKGVIPEQSITLFFFLKKDESLENRTYEVSDKKLGAGAPHVHWRSKQPDGKAKFSSAAGRYSMKLEFGTKSEGEIPVRIYLSLPDEDKSWIAGTFKLEVD